MNGGGKRIAILGSTGSIGRSTLDVVRHLPGRFRVHALAAGSNWEALLEQALEFRPRVVALEDPAAAERLRRKLGPGTEVLAGRDAACEIARSPEIELVVSALVGYEPLGVGVPVLQVSPAPQPSEDVAQGPQETPSDADEDADDKPTRSALVPVAGTSSPPARPAARTSAPAKPKATPRPTTRPSTPSTPKPPTTPDPPTTPGPSATPDPPTTPDPPPSSDPPSTGGTTE